MKIRFAVAPGASASDLGTFARFVADLERLGFDTVWLSDIPLGGVLDPVVGLSYAAAATSRLKLGANVVPLGRHPLILAKSLAQLDRLSAGRLLLSFVVGLDAPGERQALGVDGAHRGRLLEETTGLLRSWWAGETVDHKSERYTFAGVESTVRPVQQPLEIWFGGRAPAALRRVGAHADGWLGSAVTPAEAGEARRRIEEAAGDAGRAIDPEHFGLSIPYAASDLEAAGALQRARRPDVDLADIVPVGPERLQDLVARHVDAGLTKFVVRPVGRGGDDSEALERLAGVLLPLQT